MPPEEKARLGAEIARTAPSCTTQAECDAKMSAARAWILANSPYRLQHVTPDFLETYPPTSTGTGLAVRVNKQPRATGGYTIAVNVYCTNLAGCDRSPWQAALDFNRAVSQTQ